MDKKQINVKSEKSRKNSFDRTEFKSQQVPKVKASMHVKTKELILNLRDPNSPELSNLSNLSGCILDKPDKTKEVVSPIGNNSIDRYFSIVSATNTEYLGLREFSTKS